jgi:light-independent protochlorophyllide reductase subunit B
MGFEGANVIFDTWVHPLMMGLEEHLLHMFHDDFEFSEAAAPSHLGHQKQEMPAEAVAAPASNVIWLPDAEAELKKIPFFVRKKARRNTEAFASSRGVMSISVETLYDAKAHYSR